MAVGRTKQADRWEKDTQIREVTGNWLDLMNEDDITPTPTSHGALSTRVGGGMVLRGAEVGGKALETSTVLDMQNPGVPGTRSCLQTLPCTMA